jgi:hypothetical protein
LILNWVVFCLIMPVIFPIGTSLHNYLWSHCRDHIQLLYCVWHRQPDKAIRLWWIYMGVCGYLLGHSEPFPCADEPPKRKMKIYTCIFRKLCKKRGEKDVGCEML